MSEENEDDGPIKVVKFKAGPGARAYLDAIVNTGLMGKDRTAVVRTLVLEGIRDRIRDKLIERLE